MFCLTLFCFSKAANAADVFSYLGGSQYDTARGIAVDKNGSIYVTGWTFTTDMPVTANAVQATHNGGADIFAARFSPDGQTLEMLTYFGGSGNDTAHDIHVDEDGNLYIVATTTSADMMTVNPLQAALNGGSDAFILKIDHNGVLTFASYFGGSSDETGQAIAVTPGGAIALTGNTSSTDLFTTANAFDATCGSDGLCDAIVATDNNTRRSDAYIARFKPDGNTPYFPDYATYVGGNGVEAAHAIALDNAGVIYITGETSAGDFVTRNAFQPDPAGGFDGGYDGFVFVIDPAQSTDKGLVYASYLGGDGEDSGNAITVNANGSATVVGDTNSLDFPVTANAFQTDYFGGDTDVFITQIDTRASATTSLLYSSYVGGGGDESATGIALDAGDNVYIAGYTTSDDFPAEGGPQLYYQGGGDGFLIKLNVNGTTPDLASYAGGRAFDAVFDIAVDISGLVYVSGETESPGLAPSNAWQANYSDKTDASITAIDISTIHAQQNDTIASTDGGGGGNSGLWFVATILLALIHRVRFVFRT